jgi:serine/threonine protein kinase
VESPISFELKPNLEILENYSFGDLGFVLEPYLTNPLAERSMGVIYWAASEMIKSLSMLHVTLEHVHGDFKPANILLSKKFQMNLSDFDMTVPANQIKSFGGTPGYQYPYRNQEDKKQLMLYHHDAFSLGASILYMLTGTSNGVLFDEQKFPLNIWDQRIPITHVQPMFLTKAMSLIIPHLNKVIKFSSPVYELDPNTMKWKLPESAKLDELLKIVTYLIMPKLWLGQAAEKRPYPDLYQLYPMHDLVRIGLTRFKSHWIRWLCS